MRGLPLCPSFKARITQQFALYCISSELEANSIISSILHGAAMQNLSQGLMYSNIEKNKFCREYMYNDALILFNHLILSLLCSGIYSIIILYA